MAHAPENKSTQAAVETPQPSEVNRQIQSAINQGKEGEKSAIAAAQMTAHRGSETAQMATHHVADTMRHSAAAGADASQAAAQVGAHAMGRGASAMVEGQRQVFEDMAVRYEEIGQRLARTIQDTASNLREMIVSPTASTEHLRELQESMAGLVNGVVQTNMRATREMLRMTDPTAVFDLQQRFMRDYMNTLMQATTGFMRVGRQTAEQTIRPLEARMQEHQQKANGHSGHHRESGVVSDVMSQDVRVVTPDDTVQQASRMMREEDVGILPVGEGDRLVGVVTDRDVTLRLVAEGKDAARTKVREVMSAEPKYVFEDENLEHVADNMAEQQVRRLPVVNRNKRLVGVVSIGDLTRAGQRGQVSGRAMRGNSRAASPAAE